MSKAPPAPEADEDAAAQIARDNALEELPPFVSVGGKEFLPYLKTMTGGSDKETAEIAEVQYPGSKVRMGKNGRPITTMPEGATRGGEPVGGREYQINAEGLSLRDLANGGPQMAAKVIPAFAAAAAEWPAWAVTAAEPYLGTLAGDVLGVGAGVGKFLDWQDVVTRGSLAHHFGSKQP